MNISSMMKSSRWILVAILFLVIVFINYSYDPIQENLAPLNTGYVFSSTSGDKPFNTLSDKNPAKIPPPPPGPAIRCGKNNFCGAVDTSATKKVYCYGNQDGCLWNSNDCKTDDDCKKYNEDSPKYTDFTYSKDQVCKNFQIGSWPAEFCGYEKVPVKGENTNALKRCAESCPKGGQGGDVTCPTFQPTCVGHIPGRAWGTCV